MYPQNREHVSTQAEPSIVEVAGRHGIRKLIKDKFLAGRAVDMMYSNEKFPDVISAKERQWYMDLKIRANMTTNNHNVSSLQVTPQCSLTDTRRYHFPIYGPHFA